MLDFAGKALVVGVTDVSRLLLPRTNPALSCSTTLLTEGMTSVMIRKVRRCIKTNKFAVFFLIYYNDGRNLLIVTSKLIVRSSSQSVYR